jgi:hypothetical protein
MPPRTRGPVRPWPTDRSITADGGCGGGEMAAPRAGAGGANASVLNRDRTCIVHALDMEDLVPCGSYRPSGPRDRAQAAPTEASRRAEDAHDPTPGVRSHAARNSSHDNMRAQHGVSERTHARARQPTAMAQGELRAATRRPNLPTQPRADAARALWLPSDARLAPPPPPALSSAAALPALRGEGARARLAGSTTPGRSPRGEAEPRLEEAAPPGAVPGAVTGRNGGGVAPRRGTRPLTDAAAEGGANADEPAAAVALPPP